MKDIMIIESDNKGINDFQIGNALKYSIESIGKRLKRVLLIPPEWL